jgi:hypothetical protein
LGPVKQGRGRNKEEMGRERRERKGWEKKGGRYERREGGNERMGRRE